MSGIIPYTHWAYFAEEAPARACAEQDLKDYVVRIQRSVDDEDPDLRWLLLAGRDVAIDDLIDRHNEVRAIVEQHGGFYDYGEATYVLGEGAVADPMLTGEWPA